MKLPILPHDKALHLIIGLAVFTLVLPHSAGMGLVAAVAAGAGKETYDRLSGRGTPDIWDFVATALGGVWGYAIVRLTHLC